MDGPVEVELTLGEVKKALTDAAIAKARSSLSGTVTASVTLDMGTESWWPWSDWTIRRCTFLFEPKQVEHV